MRASLVLALLPLCPAIRLKDDRDALPDWARAPIVWVHTPKTGTSFANVLFHHKGLCPAFPNDAWFLQPEWSSDHEFLKAYNIHELCPGQFAKEYECPPGSVGVGDIWDQNHAHVVSFFRQPEARVTSGFFSAWHDFPRHFDKEGHGREWLVAQTGEGMNIRGYASVMQGCQVRMLTQGGKACGGNGTKPTMEDVDLAIGRMKQMKFVGLTEEWDLSICLFHKMYGGQCHDQEFSNTRPMHERQTYTVHHRLYTGDDLDLKGFQDPYDGALYDAAKIRFMSMMREYDVDRATCEQSCGSQLKINPFRVKTSSVMEGGDGIKSEFKYDWPGRPTYYVDEDEFVPQ